MPKKPFISPLLKKGFKIYLATQPANLENLTINQGLKPHTQFFNCLLEENKNWYRNRITSLNVAVFGPLGMPTEPWVDHHFGIVCGVTLGFLDEAGEPITMIRACHHFEGKTTQMWTFLVDPRYQNMGLGKNTLALLCEFCQNQERITFTTQLNSSSIAAYLHLTNKSEPLKLDAIGFHHTHPNSVLVGTKMPQNPKTILEKYKMPEIKEAILITPKTKLKAGKYLLRATDLNAIKRISQDLKKGREYRLIGWYSNGLGINEPLTMLEIIK